MSAVLAVATAPVRAALLRGQVWCRPLREVLAQRAGRAILDFKEDF